MRRSWLFLGWLLAVSMGSVPARATDKPDVRAKVIVPEHAAAGSKVPVVVEMGIAPGFHVNSHTPSDKFLIPTNVAVSATAGSLSAFRYPRDVEKRFSFSDKPLRVYEGTVRFEADLELPAHTKGEVRLQGGLTYQACNDVQCFAPAKIPLEALLTASASR
jgi:hypothetical protein